MWVTEDPWPPMIICLVLAAVLYIAWMNNARKRYLAGIAGLVLLAVGFYFLEQVLISPAEKMEENIQALVTAFENKEADTVIAFLSPSLQEKHGGRIEFVMENVEIIGHLELEPQTTTFSNEQKQADTRFLIKGTLSYKESDQRYYPTLWDFIWERKEDKWIITTIKRLNPVNKEEINVFQ